MSTQNAIYPNLNGVARYPQATSTEPSTTDSFGFVFLYIFTSLVVVYKTCYLEDVDNFFEYLLYIFMYVGTILSIVSTRNIKLPPNASYGTIIYYICFSYVLSIVMFQSKFWYSYFTEDILQEGEFNDAMLFLSSAGSMFLFSYGLLTRAIHEKGLDKQFVYTQKIIWIAFLMFTLYFWDYCTFFFKLSNLISSFLVLSVLYKI